MSSLPREVASSGRLITLLPVRDNPDKPYDTISHSVDSCVSDLSRCNIAEHFERAESPLARGGREKVMIVQEDSAGKCGEGFSKGSLSFQKEGSSDGPRGSMSQDGGEFLQDEMVRRREQALRQHAFFQLRLHIRRGANLVAMDRGGKMGS